LHGRIKNISGRKVLSCKNIENCEKYNVPNKEIERVES
jgi:hypothetical protein